ncbi:MAG: DUF2934 domain-containing protein [Bryobacteraceae bacterium]|nr:DUF2934 domain-containing protein [Bryobacteraceae bacterium]
MPAKKKAIEAPVAAPAAAPKRRTAARSEKVEVAAAAVPAPEVKAKSKTATKSKSAPKTPAATHKATPRKSAPRAKAATAPAFDVDQHRAEIEQEAYFLWINRGGAHGHATEDWLRAVEIVQARRG